MQMAGKGRYWFKMTGKRRYWWKRKEKRGKGRYWCNNHGFSGNQEEVTEREQLSVAEDWRGKAATGIKIEISNIKIYYMWVKFGEAAAGIKSSKKNIMTMLNDPTTPKLAIHSVPLIVIIKKTCSENIT